MNQVLTLVTRDLKVYCRDPMGIGVSFLEAVSLRVFTAWIFLKLGGNLAGISSRQGALYAASSLQGHLILLFETYHLTMDMEIFDREKSEGVAAAVSSFMISRRLARAFIEDIPVPLIFSLVFYFMVGLRPLASQFFTFVAIMLMDQYLAVHSL